MDNWREEANIHAQYSSHSKHNNYYVIWDVCAPSPPPVFLFSLRNSSVHNLKECCLYTSNFVQNTKLENMSSDKRIIIYQHVFDMILTLFFLQYFFFLPAYMKDTWMDFFTFILLYHWIRSIYVLNAIVYYFT